MRFLCVCVLEFSAVEELANLRELNEEQKQTISEVEEKMEDLLTRPQIEENEMIVDKLEYEATISEKERLAEQVDSLEIAVKDAKESAVPEQEKNAAIEAFQVCITFLCSRFLHYLFTYLRMIF